MICLQVCKKTLFVTTKHNKTLASRCFLVQFGIFSASFFLNQKNRPCLISSPPIAGNLGTSHGWQLERFPPLGLELERWPQKVVSLVRESDPQKWPYCNIIPVKDLFLINWPGRNFKGSKVFSQLLSPPEDLSPKFDGIKSWWVLKSLKMQWITSRPTIPKKGPVLK